MTANQIYKKMIATAQTLSVAEIKAQIVRLMDDTSESAGTLFNVMLSALEGKVSESEYVEFCNAI
jgi:hypothetical protein